MNKTSDNSSANSFLYRQWLEECSEEETMPVTEIDSPVLRCLADEHNVTVNDLLEIKIAKSAQTIRRMQVYLRMLTIGCLQQKLSQFEIATNSEAQAFKEEVDDLQNNPQAIVTHRLLAFLQKIESTLPKVLTNYRPEKHEPITTLVV